MEFVESTRKYFMTFYILGILPSLPKGIHSSILTNNVTQKMLMVTHATIGLGLTVSIMITVIRNHDAIRYGRTEIPIISMVAICEVLRVVFTLIQCIFQKHIISEIFNDFQKFESYFALHFRYQIHYKTFNKAFFAKVIIVAVACIQYNLLYIFRIVVLKGLIGHGIQLNLMQAFAVPTFLHIIFYVEILGFYLDQLNNVIENDIHTRQVLSILLIRNFPNLIQIRNKINYVKSVHFRLWDISKKINNYFGWCMVVISFQAFANIFYSAYWLYSHLQQKRPFSRVVRK